MYHGVCKCTIPTVGPRPHVPTRPSALAAAADPRLAGGGVKRLAKSRYDAISCYIYSCQQPAAAAAGPPSSPPQSSSTDRSGSFVGGDAVLNAYNDAPVEVDEALEALLLGRGVDAILARHVAHLFTRDPLVVFQGAIGEVDDASSTEHFENIQVGVGAGVGMWMDGWMVVGWLIEGRKRGALLLSLSSWLASSRPPTHSPHTHTPHTQSTNWQSVRWKPPPPAQSPTDPRIGWRTEFRCALFSVFVVVLLMSLLSLMVARRRASRITHQMGLIDFFLPSQTALLQPRRPNNTIHRLHLRSQRRPSNTIHLLLALASSSTTAQDDGEPADGLRERGLHRLHRPRHAHHPGVRPLPLHSHLQGKRKTGRKTTRLWGGGCALTHVCPCTMMGKEHTHPVSMHEAHRSSKSINASQRLIRQHTHTHACSCTNQSTITTTFDAKETQQHPHPSHAQLDENMRRAHARDAVQQEKFFFRKHMADLNGDGGDGVGADGREHCGCTTVAVSEFSVAGGGGGGGGGGWVGGWTN